MADILLFDLDDTILDFHRAERIAISKAFTDFGIEPTERLLARYHICNVLHWQMLERGEITRPQVLTGRFRMLFDEYGITASPERIVEVYEAYLCEGHYFMDGAEEMLQRLSGKYRMFIVSNGTAVVQKSRLASARLSRFMEDVFVSEMIGADKPSRIFFERCFERIPDFARERAVVIGDSLTSDILGGINAGVRTIWYNPRHTPNNTDIRPDFEIDDFVKIDALLADMKK